MQYAVTLNGDKVEASKGVQARCPNCNAEVIAKCGSVKVHHWAHAKGSDCDTWYEPETEWHRSWKGLFKPECQEVVMGEHRADISNGTTVVELQNSPISAEEIGRRERFYGNMIWIVNASKFADRFFLMKLLKGRLFTFKWKSMAKSWLAANKPVYLDFGSVTVAQLLGAEYYESSSFYNSSGEEESHGRTSIVRYRGPDYEKGPHSTYSADEGFKSLSEGTLARTILKINTIYGNGNGSAGAISSRTIFQVHDLESSRFFDISAFD